MKIPLQQCLLASLAQLTKGQDRNSPGSENCEKRGQTLYPPWVPLPAALGGLAKTLSWLQGLSLPPAPDTLGVYPQLASGYLCAYGRVGWPLFGFCFGLVLAPVEDPCLGFDPTHPHPSLAAQARNVV